jgi:O-antigen/teichoic acid export membrane protein
MVLVYGSQYAGGGAILTVLLLSVLALSLQIVAGNGLWSIGRPKATFVPQLCVLVVTLGTAAALVGPLGPLGAALASLAGAVTGAALTTFNFLQLIRTVSAEPACA